jgi:hypothetical protein
MSRPRISLPRQAARRCGGLSQDAGDAGIAGGERRLPAEALAWPRRVLRGCAPEGATLKCFLKFLSVDRVESMEHVKGEMGMVNLRSKAAKFSLVGIVLAVVVAVVFMVGITPGKAHKAVNTTIFGVAIKGYDPVAYFTEGRAVPGKKEFEHTWHAARWRFASAEHQKLFVAAPERYTPQYGGFCANAMTVGKVASVDPEAWKIVDGKLYLGYNKALMAKWDGRPMAAVKDRIKQADAHWAELHGKN